MGDWLVERTTGKGQVIAGVIRHVRSCIKKHEAEMPQWLKEAKA